MTSGELSNFSRKSLSGGGTNEGQTIKLVAEVKHVREAPNPADRRIEVKLNDKSSRTDKVFVDAERRIAENLRLGRRYEMILSEGPNRGGGSSAFSAMKDVKRMKGKPVEVSDRGGGGRNSMGDRFGKGYSGSHMDFL
jgi:hypothetical protein